MSLWDQLYRKKNRKSDVTPPPPQQPTPPPSQNTARDIFSDTKFLLKDQQVKTIFDVGANRGDFTHEYVQSYPDATIHCFEPNPTTCETLRHRFKDYPQVMIQTMAVSNVQGQVDFCCNKECATDSLLSPSPHWKEWIDGKRDSLVLTSRIRVKTTTLDQFCEDHSIQEIDILKMDTQGAEHLVLGGAQRLMQKKAIRLIIAELLFVPLYAGQPFYYEVCSQLADHGYNLVNLYDHRYDDDFAIQLKWADGVFIHREW